MARPQFGPESYKGDLMNYFEQHVLQTRRRFLTSAASGAGVAALASLMRDEGLLAAESSAPAGFVDPLRPRAPHFPGKAKSCIFIFLAGGTSHLDLFDPKPKLNELDGKPIPESFTKGVRFSFIKLNESLLMGSRFKFQKYGQCGMEMSELLPKIGSCADDIALVRSMHHAAFDHAPGELEIITGKDTPGRPSFGAWLTYGLGSESQNLPGYVALINHRGPVARAMAWGNGYLPSVHQGVVFRNQGEPILNLQTPDSISPELHRAQLDAMRELNRLKSDKVRDPEIDARIAAYELAYRMQTAAPELIDIVSETKPTLEAYGVDRPGQKGVFSRNCLLARRLVERGVRVVSLFQRTWDQHRNLDGELRAQCDEVDQPIGALLQDLKQRGLLDSTLVVWGTEFGRTAITENAKPGPAAGRDHHPHAFSMWMAGGGVNGGQVIGKSDDLGWAVAEDGVHTHDFHATLLHLFGFDHKKLTYRHRGIDTRLTDVAGNVVEKLLA